MLILIGNCHRACDQQEIPRKSRQSKYRIANDKTTSSIVKTCCKNRRIKVSTSSLIQQAQFRKKTTGFHSSKKLQETPKAIGRA